MKALTTVLTKILEVICAVLFALLVVIVVWQVIARQLLDNPQAWTEEASRMTFVWLGLFAAALVFAERGHIAVDFVVRMFGNGAQKVVAIVVQLLIIFFALALLVWGGWVAGQGAGNQHLAALDFLTLGQMYMVMPITGVIITLFAIENIISIANGSEPAFAASEEEELLEQLEAEGALSHEPIDTVSDDEKRG
ncbi:MAG: TRAP transporter small permease [Dermatophilus congolensis]|nr:TRAP transporter small permease [Dermatophilus congolensis]